MFSTALPGYLPLFPARKSEIEQAGRRYDSDVARSESPYATVSRALMNPGTVLLSRPAAG